MNGRTARLIRKLAAKIPKERPVPPAAFPKFWKRIWQGLNRSKRAATRREWARRAKA